MEHFDLDAFYGGSATELYRTLGAVILRGAGEYKKPKAKKSKAREELPA